MMRSGFVEGARSLLCKASRARVALSDSSNPEKLVAESMKKHVSARKRASLQLLNAELVRQVMSGIFPPKNDYVEDMALYEDLLPELRRFGIADRGTLKRLMTRHRRSLLADDRSRLAV